MTYPEESWLMLSGIQHFVFCRRQWGLIHIEQIWQDNLLTVDGTLLHGRVHDPKVDETRPGVRIVRGLNIHSAELGISGQCDVVEFHSNPQGVPIHGRNGLWQPVPVEYKRGTVKVGDEDRLQLCAQAVCLEEMLNCCVSEGYLFYHEIRHREAVIFSESLRDKLRKTVAEMHYFYREGRTPEPPKKVPCQRCSLREVCVPSLERKSVTDYLLGKISEPF